MKLCVKLEPISTVPLSGTRESRGHARTPHIPNYVHSSNPLAYGIGNRSYWPLWHLAHLGRFYGSATYGVTCPRAGCFTVKLYSNALTRLLWTIKGLLWYATAWAADYDAWLLSM